MAWTQARVDTLKKLWAANWTCSQIAAELNCGISRNGVIGKINRLGLSGRQKPIRVSEAKPVHHHPPKRPKPAHDFPRSPSKGKDKSMPKPPKPLPPDIVNPLSLYTPVRVGDLEPSSCRWPLGDPIRDFDGFRYCGAPRDGECSYCLYHRGIAYQPREMRQHRRESDKRTLGGVIGAIQQYPWTPNRKNTAVAG